MSRKLMAVCVFLLPLLLLCSDRPATAGIHQAWDEAHFVKPPTLQQVDQVIDEIHAKFGKDLMIETFASIPDDLKANLTKDGKDVFYEKWTRTEADELGVNGVMILITGAPPHLQVEVGVETQNSAFTLADRDELVKLMAAAFRQHDFDAGLLQAAQFVRDRMARNFSTAPAAGSTTQPTQPAATQPHL